MAFGFYLFQLGEFSDPDNIFSGSENSIPSGAGVGSSFSLNSTASGTVIETQAGPDDGGEPLISPVTVNGTTYDAGTNVEAEYEIIVKGAEPDPASGDPQLYYRVTGIQIGNDWAGVVVSQPWRADIGEYVTDAPVPRGLTLTAIDGDDLDGTPNITDFASDPNYERIMGNDAAALDAVGGTIPCFTSGTLIETANGVCVAIDDLQASDLVMTRDNGLHPIRWIGSATLTSAALDGAENLRPIRIKRHALDTNVPSQDLLVSPQHRVLVRSKIAQRMFGTDEVLVAAKQLRALDGIETAHDVTEVTYFHILFDQHEVVVSNGAETESLYTGPEALKSVGDAAREEIFTLFPELRDENHSPKAARVLSPGRKGRRLADRHRQNGQPLV